MTTPAEPEPLYPDDEDLGATRVWTLPLQGERTLTLTARFLGLGSSRSQVHSHPGDDNPDDRRCFACRWYEPRIFKESDGEQRYMLYTVGASEVAGEIDRIKYRYAADAYEAVMILSVPHQSDKNKRFLSAPAKEMFLTASSFDAVIACANDCMDAVEAGQRRTA